MPDLFLTDELATENLGVLHASQTPPGGTWLLNGELGSGKTTWTRGFVKGLGGCADQVSSPTYAVLHRYDASTGKVFHLDLYRIGHSGIWSLGLEDCITQNDWLVVEWAGLDGPWVSDWVSSLDLRLKPGNATGGRIATWDGSIVGDKNYK